MTTSEPFNLDHFEILDEIPSGKIVIDPELNVVFWNTAMERWTGLSKQEVIGTNLVTRYPHLNLPRFQMRIKDVFELGMPVFYTPAINQHFIPIQLPNQGLMMQEARVTRIDRFPQLAIVSIQDCNTQYMHLNNLREQIRQRRQVEQSLTDQNRILNTVRKFQSRFIESNHHSNVFREILKEFLELTGSRLAFLGLVSDQQDQLDIKVEAICHGDIPPHVVNFLLQAERTPLSFSNRNSLLAKVVSSGEPLISHNPGQDTRGVGVPANHPQLDSFMGLPLRLDDRVIGIIGLANTEDQYSEDQAKHLEPILAATSQFVRAREHDKERARMHEQLKRHAEELERAKLEAEKAVRVKSEFLANMSHEIRTPMTAILGYTEILQDPGSDTDMSQKAIQTIQRNGEHLLCLINDILDLSKIESGHMIMESIPCNLQELMDGVIEMLRGRAVNKQIQLDAFRKHDVPSRIITDPTRLHQILVNLVGNAIKFTNEGFVRLTARLIEQTGNVARVAFDVADTGIGIPQDKLSTLFDAFTQADSSTTRKYGGTGLGLAISQNLCQGLGGDLTVVSRHGFGSTFTATLQVQLQDNDNVNQTPVYQTNLDSNPQPVEGTLPRDHKLQILVADDSDDNRKLIEFFLRKTHCDCTYVVDGEQALQAAIGAHLAGSPFDLILLDMQMPIRDGYSTATELKQQGIRSHIIALTANAMKSDRQRCLDAGCDDYLSKPIDRAAMLEKIKMAKVATAPVRDAHVNVRST